MVGSWLMNIPSNPPTGGGWGDLGATQGLYLLLFIPGVVFFYFMFRRQDKKGKHKPDAYTSRRRW